MTPHQAARIWAECHHSADANTTMILAAKTAEESTLVSDICAAKMVALKNAEKLLFSYTDHPDAPEGLKRWARAEADKGCRSCWLSSRIDKQHPECQAKIKEWFAAREALYESFYQKPIVVDGGPMVHTNGWILPETLKVPFHIRYTIELRESDQGERWVIKEGGRACLSKSLGEFVYEPMPSNRTDDFLDDTRFNSMEEAMIFLEKWKKEELARVQKLENYKIWPHEEIK